MTAPGSRDLLAQTDRLLIMSTLPPAGESCDSRDPRVLVDIGRLRGLLGLAEITDHGLARIMAIRVGCGADEAVTLIPFEDPEVEVRLSIDMLYCDQLYKDTFYRLDRIAQADRAFDVTFATR